MKTLLIAFSFAMISPAFASTVKSNPSNSFTHQTVKCDIGDNDLPKDGEKPKG